MPVGATPQATDWQGVMVRRRQSSKEATPSGPTKRHCVFCWTRHVPPARRDLPRPEEDRWMLFA